MHVKGETITARNRSRKRGSGRGEKTRAKVSPEGFPHVAGKANAAAQLPTLPIEGKKKKHVKRRRGEVAGAAR